MEEEPVETIEPLDFAQDGPGLFDDAPIAPLAKVKPSLSGVDLRDDEDDDAPLALYRRYRPQVFAEVIGQEHVTEPLKRALTNNRVNHAYLFSGPRGCGKTSSARILARSLNCEQGPTPEPCGVCQSCRDLGRGGAGSLDVIEIDAASHGGVDDARDLRERAFFAPVASRYKIYIVDEAHMVSPQGFNALLKLVEEPPPHVKFIFATTEPDKVIGTIRSRTHHYPFRLIPPKTMAAYLAEICRQEQVKVEPAALQLVVRAGAGSVRDSLSVLDQLLGGADADGVQYAQAAALLGYTPDSLLDEVVDAFAAGSAPGVFGGVDRVIESGQDPRRFTEDLLQRFRDLMIVAAVPDALSSGLLDVAEDQADRFRAQADRLQVGGLTRAAEILAAGLVGMRGTTAPRLNLELMCSRILLPGSQGGEPGLAARLDRLEKQLANSAVPVVNSSGANPSAAANQSPPPAVPAASRPSVPVGSVPVESVPVGSAPVGSGQRPAATPPVAVSSRQPVEPDLVAPSVPPADPAGQIEPPVAPTEASALTTATIARGWPRVLQRISTATRYVWMILNQYASITELVGSTLWLTFSDAAARDNFAHRNGEESVAEAIRAELQAEVTVRARLATEPIPPAGRTAILSLAPDAGPAAASPNRAGVPERLTAVSPPGPSPAVTSSMLTPEMPSSGPSSAAADPANPPKRTAPADLDTTPAVTPTPDRSPDETEQPGAADAAGKTNPPPHHLGPANRKTPPEPEDEPDIESDIILDADQSEAETIIDDLLGATFVKAETTPSPRRRGGRR